MNKRDVTYIQQAIDNLQYALKYTAGDTVCDWEDERLQDLYWTCNDLWLKLQQEKQEGRYDS